MDANQTFIDTWILKSISKDGQTGFSAGQQIKYGVLLSGFIESRLSIPKPESYPPLGVNDPAYQSDLDTWQKKYQRKGSE